LVYIRDYRPLFNVIGTAYGGDGKLTMGVPDLQGRTVVGQGTLSGGGTYTLTQKGGAETVTVTSDMVPQHTHWLAASSRDGTTNNPAGGLLANVVGGGPLDQSTGYIYNPARPTAQLYNISVVPVGGQKPHNNMQPSLAVRYCIACAGSPPPPPRS